ncbi:MULTISPECIES: DUF4123 domain-containing protein [Achromobacter]|uniref:DUF4123 domain-containing protein n=1 Tax=Achromobacter TaxID=222 RepID=UPI00244B3200|nr:MULTISPECIES: DUF4123 domain-containing protein [Achromobacter]MDH1301886.1 DUF4123 domain-containing protein [Achromobacter sp. GD03932]WLW62626.1 DUF4123 domain-containing protein [Achromobacter aegrifaciens]
MPEERHEAGIASGVSHMSNQVRPLVLHSDLDGLHARVQASARVQVSDLNLFALVEPGMLDGCRDPAPAELLRHFREPGDASLYARRHEAVAASIGPMLAQPDLPQAEWLWRVGQAHHAVSWIWTERPLEEMARHLAVWLDARTDDGLDFLLRYYDPRHAEPMLTLMGVDVLRGMLDPGESWSWVDPWNRVCSLTPTSDGPVEKPGAPPWILTQPQTEALMRLCEPGPLLDALMQRVPAMLAPWTRPTPYALACHLSRVAAAHGLTTFERQFCYALDALDLHPMAHRSSVVQARLRNGEALDSALERLASEERAAVRAELAMQNGATEFEAPAGYAIEPLPTEFAHRRVA